LVRVAGYPVRMNQKHALATTAALIADPARAAMLVALLDGRALTAGELARAADVSAQSASSHLSKLASGGLIVVHPQGRHRYYRMAGPEVGHVLEALGVIATTRPAGRVMRTPHDEALCTARTCYDHLAGRLAVDLTALFEREGVLIATGSRDYLPGPHVSTYLTRLGLDASAVSTRRRTFARRCLDWTERRPHVSGALGAQLLDSFLTRGWLARKTGSRALRLTDRAVRGFTELGMQELVRTARPVDLHLTP